MTIVTPIILALIVTGIWGYRQAVVTPTSTPSPTVEPTQTPVPTSTPSPTPSSTPTPKPTAIPTSTPIPQPKYSSEQIYEFTNRFGNQYGVDPNVLRYIALCESGFRPEARNYVYGGLYQFSPNTWASYRKKMGEDQSADLRYNAEEAVQTAAFALSLGMGKIWPNCQP